MKVALLKGHMKMSGGLEKMTLKLAAKFALRGCEVTLLTTGDLNPLPNIKTHTFGPKSKWSYRHLKKFDERCLEWLKDHPHEIVFGMERNSFQTHYRAGSGVHAAYLNQRALTDPLWKRISFKFNPLHKRILQLEKKCFEEKRLRTVFTNSYMVKREILNHYQIESHKIEVVHNGAPYLEWKPFFEESLQVKKEVFHFLFVGSGFRRKGLNFLLQGLSLLPKGGWRLLVVGKDKEQPHFEALAKKLKIDATFFGAQKNVIPFYQKSDCLVIPSTYDPFAGVTVEALAMGLFVVSSKFNGGHEVLNSLNGVVIEELSDPHSIAFSLKHALQFPKSAASAEKIRESIRYLDLTSSLDRIVEHTLR